jgi:hypothetical protein
MPSYLCLCLFKLMIHLLPCRAFTTGTVLEVVRKEQGAIRGLCSLKQTRESVFLPSLHHARKDFFQEGLLGPWGLHSGRWEPQSWAKRLAGGARTGLPAFGVACHSGSLDSQVWVWAFRTVSELCPLQSPSYALQWAHWVARFQGGRDGPVQSLLSSCSRARPSKLLRLLFVLIFLLLYCCPGGTTKVLTVYFS